ncbi:MAG: hypothetical protein HKN70_03085 [Gammaproteobacteria bacterium]|nr:hypothetical protein [Gammaproteobacteria bacterium]
MAVQGLKVQGFVQESSNIFAENRLLKFGFACVTVLMLVLFYRVMTIDEAVKERIIPLGAQGDLVISGNSASDDYLASMGKTIVYMLGSYHAGSIRGQLNDLLKIYHPTTYTETRDVFTEVADRAERYASVSFALQWDSGKPIEITKDTIQVRARRLRIVGDSVPRKEAVTFRIHYVIEQGRFWIKNVEEITDAQAHS